MKVAAKVTVMDSKLYWVVLGRIVSLLVKKL